jgi:hypothetical protein
MSAVEVSYGIMCRAERYLTVYKFTFLLNVKKEKFDATELRNHVFSSASFEPISVASQTGHTYKNNVTVLTK